MTTFIADTIAIACYLGCALYLAISILKHHRTPANRSLVLTVTTIGLLAHWTSIAASIVTPAGIKLDFFNISPIIFAFITLLTTVGSLRRPLESLLTILLPFSALSILIGVIYDDSLQVDKHFDSKIAGHILLSVLAYSVMTVAVFQAMALALQERLLRHHKLGGVLQAFPPLQTMEQVLFEIIFVGVVLLSLSILTGVLFIEDIFAQHLVHKTVLTIMAWCIFSILLWGRHQLGWRGRTAIRWTIAGFIVLMLGYFGSKLVLEIILQRG